MDDARGVEEEPAAVGRSDAPPKGGGAQGVEVIPLVYDFLVWIGPKLGSFPRVHRFTVGDRIMITALEVLDHLLMARYDREERQPALRRANLALERLRYLMRLSRDLHCISLKQYEYAARCLVESGRQVGGWLRHARGGRSRRSG